MRSDLAQVQSACGGLWHDTIRDFSGAPCHLFPLEWEPSSERECLLHCAMRLGDRSAVIHNPRKIRVGEGDASKRMVAHQFRGRGLAILAKEKSRLRRKIRMSPAVQNDSRNVAPSIESLL